ncbi:MAG: type II toxin-antitoxin system VapC family toxin [Spirochaetia bacterium]|nr:type II toxin-antitoxin system VapC family toxin [Spirochaetia bacterium]
MSPIYLLDTNVISEMTRPVPNSVVIQKIFENEKLCAISAVGWGECLYGLKRLPEGKRKESIYDFYMNTINHVYRKLPFDESAANIYSDIKSRLEDQGKIASELDMQIAATSIANNTILVTRNVKDFKHICEVSALMLENWFA